MLDMLDKDIDIEWLNRISELLKAIANPNRIAIVRLLAKEGRLSVSQICRYLDMKQATASIYLNRMAKTGILSCKRQGKEVFYFVDSKTVLEVLHCLGACVKKGGE